MIQTAEEAAVTTVSEFEARRSARRLIGLYDELDDIDPHGAAVIREEPVEGGSLYETWERFVEALREAAEDRAEAPRILEESSHELSGRPFRFLAPEFEYLVADSLESAREELPLRERADTVVQLFAELKDVDETGAAELLSLPVHHNSPVPQLQRGATYEQVLEALSGAREQSWDNIESDPNGIAVVILKSEITVMEAELRERLRATGAVACLH